MADTDEKIGVSSTLNAQIERARGIAKMLDTAVRIPGTGIRFGLDSVLGLIPGMGDAAGALFSGYLILLGSRMGLPRAVITRAQARVRALIAREGRPARGSS